jgi:hypothetical protein
MTRENIAELRAKIIQGLELAYTRLLISKQKNDEELVFSKNGKIVRIKARDLSK